MSATTAVLPECDRCKRPAKLYTLYYRQAPGNPAVLAGRYGRKCFYDVAWALWGKGFQPERQNARRINLRGRM